MHSTDDVQAGRPADDDARFLDTATEEQDRASLDSENAAPEDHGSDPEEHDDAADGVEHRAYLVEHFRRYDTLAHLVTSLDGAPCAVFVDRDRDATEVGAMLTQDELAVTILLSEGDDEERRSAVAALEAGEVRLLVTTDEALAEVDLESSATSIQHVVHTDLPDDEQAYRWRVGLLAGDGGRTSHLFVVPKRERYTSRLFEEAGIALRFGDAPQAERITERREKERTERFVKSLLQTIQEEEGLPLDQADRLLEHFEARDLVAALLWRADRTRQREQREERGTLRPHERQDRGGRYEERRGGDRDRNRGRFEASRGDRRDSRDRRQGGDSFDGGVRFFVNWGRNQGATPNRLLAAICRRGQVEGTMIGSIAIHPNASTFDVRPDVAESFERLAGRPDERDPQTWIRRDRGPSHEGRGDDRGGRGRSYGGHGDRDRSYGGRGDRGGRGYDNRGGDRRSFDRGGRGGDRDDRRGYRGGDSRGYGRGDGRGDRHDGARRPYRPYRSGRDEGQGGSGSYRRDGDRGGYRGNDRGNDRGGYRDDRGGRGGYGSRGGGDRRGGYRSGGDRQGGYRGR